MNQEINKALTALEQGGTILYPTDTIWGIGCDATDSEAVSKVYDLKKRADSKALICLVSDEYMLKKHVERVPEIAYNLIALSERPMTIIYDDPKGVAPGLVANDNSLAIRVTNDPFCRSLIARLKKPLVSTSANMSGNPSPGSFLEIDPAIKPGVDHVVDLHRDQKNGAPSAIVKLGSNGEVTIIRK